MIQYSKEELISATDLAKNMSKFLTGLKKNQSHKLAIIHNNRPTAVLMPIEEYERLQKAFELLEHTEIYQTITRRLQTPVEEYLDHAELLNQLQQD